MLSIFTALDTELAVFFTLVNLIRNNWKDEHFSNLKLMWKHNEIMTKMGKNRKKNHLEKPLILGAFLDKK